MLKIVKEGVGSGEMKVGCVNVCAKRVWVKLVCAVVRFQVASYLSCGITFPRWLYLATLNSYNL